MEGVNINNLKGGSEAFEWGIRVGDTGIFAVERMKGHGVVQSVFSTFHLSLILKPTLKGILLISLHFISERRNSRFDPSTFGSGLNSSLNY